MSPEKEEEKLAENSESSFKVYVVVGGMGSKTYLVTPNSC